MAPQSTLKFRVVDKILLSVLLVFALVSVASALLFGPFVTQLGWGTRDRPVDLPDADEDDKQGGWALINTIIRLAGGALLLIFSVFVLIITCLKNTKGGVIYVGAIGGLVGSLGLGAACVFDILSLLTGVADHCSDPTECDLLYYILTIAIEGTACIIGIIEAILLLMLAKRRQEAAKDVVVDIATGVGPKEVSIQKKKTKEPEKVKSEPTKGKLQEEEEKKREEKWEEKEQEDAEEAEILEDLEKQ